MSAAALIKFFRASNVALIRGLRLFEGGTYLKIGRDEEIFSINLMVYFLSVRKFLSPFVSSST